MIRQVSPVDNNEDDDPFGRGGHLVLSSPNTASGTTTSVDLLHHLGLCSPMNSMLLDGLQIG